jgi:hypothetical protein
MCVSKTIGFFGVLILAFTVSSFCFPTAKADTFTGTSKLEVQTFQSDFVFLNWYLEANVTNSSSSMILVFANLLNETGLLPISSSSPLSISPIDKSFDPLTNITTFSIDGAVPLGTVSSDFPNDRYEANYYIGCNFLPENATFAMMPNGNIPGPTDNYQVSWSLSPEPNFTSTFDNLTRFALNNTIISQDITSWFHLNLLIFHRPPFSQYVGILVDQVPFWLETFGVFMAGLILVPTYIELFLKQPRKLKRARFIETILVPISASVIVFVPVYELALHVFEAPLLIPTVEQHMIQLLSVYATVLVFGIPARVAASLRERKPQKPKKSPQEENPPLKPEEY